MRLEQLFQDYYAPSTQNDVFCEKCQKYWLIQHRSAPDLYSLPSNITRALKRFTDDLNKNTNPVRLRTELNIQNVQYKLFATCNYHGNEVRGGHYTALCFHNSSWLLLDDRSIQELSIPASFSLAYMLFYIKKIV